MARTSTALAFGAAQFLVFGSLSVLQVAPGDLFVPLLLTMHGGLLLFAKLGRVESSRVERARIKRGTYLLMAMYLPALAYRLFGKLGLLEVRRPVLCGGTLALAVLAMLLIVWSVRVAGSVAGGGHAPVSDRLSPPGNGPR